MQRYRVHFRMIPFVLLKRDYLYTLLLSGVHFTNEKSLQTPSCLLFKNQVKLLHVKHERIISNVSAAWRMTIASGLYATHITMLLSENSVSHI